MIDRIREAANVAELVSAMVELRGSGVRLVGNCPFHQDTNASLTVYTDSNSWHCFGCKRGGSAYDWVMERDKCSFVDAGVTLANLTGIPWGQMTEAEGEDHDLRVEAYAILAAYADKCGEKLQKTPAALDYLHEQGITDESIREYRIGYGIEIRENTITEPMYHAGLVKSTEHGLWQPMKGRIVFPVIQHGQVVQLSGRRMPGSKSDKKYISLPVTLAISGIVPWNSHRLRGEKCILVEGVKDAILLEQAGFPACSTISSLFKAEWRKMLRDRTHYLCCYDGDENGAGQDANLAVATMLSDWGHRVSIVSLPVPSDPADFIQAEGAGAFQALVDRAETLTEFMIGRLPSSLSEHEYDSLLSPIFATMSGLPESAKEAYIARLSKTISVPKAALRTDIQKLGKNGHARPEAEPFSEGAADNIEWRKTDPIKFNPAQDVIGGTLYYTIYLQMSSGAFIPFIVTSKRECFPMTRETLLERDYVLRTALPPSDTGRWSIGTEVPYNVKDYLDGKTEIDSAELYAEIKGYFERFILLPDPLFYDFLALWVMGTYVFRAIDAYGYVFLCAIKGAGKSQTMTIIDYLAFNSKKADTMTEASLKRSVAGDSSTILYDEAEKLWRKFEKDESSFQEVIKGGYTRSGSAMSVNKDTHLLEEFPTYSPKVFANTRGMDETIGDRCIMLLIKKTVSELPQFVDAEQAGKLKVIRNKLYCWALQEISNLLEVKDGLRRPKGLSGRDWQLWHGVFMIAALLDGYKAVAPADIETNSGEIKHTEGLLDRMHLMAEERKRSKIREEEEENQELRTLMAIWDYCCETATLDDWYQASEICEAVRSALGREKYSSTTLFHAMHNKLHIIDPERDKDRRRIPGVKGGPKTVYRINRLTVQQVARESFGAELVDPYAVDEPEQ
ncbi:MAG: hypothetical protein KBC96_15180 [Armatimonadetes bacterium]|nr:hypothetical protein [Armatimonadota bacterium]